MADEPKFKTKNLVSESPKKYGLKAWIGLGIVLALGLGVWGNQRYQDRRVQSNAYESAIRNAERARTLEDPDRAIKALTSASGLAKRVKPGHPKYEAAQEEILSYEKEIQAIEDKAKVDAEAAQAEETALTKAQLQEAAKDYEIFIGTFDPNGSIVSNVALDPNIDTQIIVTVGRSWGAANKTDKLDFANTLWRGWGQVCKCQGPRIKFKSQAGRDLGGTGIFGTAIDLKD